ncbi:MAG: (2Fe-2S)-binding protein [Eubacteriales bacterium]
MDEVFVCRCEEVTQEELQKAIADGAVTMNELKRWTRAGMGLCQGKGCSILVMNILAKSTGQSPADVKPAHYRNPVRPMPINSMIKEEE